MKHEWEYKKLGEVATFQRGLTYSSDDEVDFSTKCVLRSNNINLENSCLDLTELKYLREDFVIPEDRMFCDNSIFICMSNGSKQHIGKVAYIKDKINYAFGGFMGLIVPKPSVQGKFVFYNLRSSQFKHFLNSIGEGANIKNLRFTDLSKYTISTPPLPTQQSIVSELDSLSKIIADCKETLKDYDALEQSIFFDMFGDPVKNDRGWEVKKLEDATADDCPISYGIVQPGDGETSGIPVVRPVDLTDTYVYPDKLKLTTQEISNQYKRTILKGNEILMCVRGTTGIVSIASAKLAGCNVTRGIVPLSFDEKADEFFMFFQFRTHSIKYLIEEKTYGATLKQINMKDLRELPVILPPLPLQQQFASKIEAIEQMKSETKKALQEAETLFNARMDYWFN